MALCNRANIQVTRLALAIVAISQQLLAAISQQLLAAISQQLPEQDLSLGYLLQEAIDNPDTNFVVVNFLTSIPLR